MKIPELEAVSTLCTALSVSGLDAQTERHVYHRLHCSIFCSHQHNTPLQLEVILQLDYIT